MKEYLRRMAAALMRSLSNALAAMASSIGRFFYSRPALKRGALVFGLQQVVVLPLSLVAGLGSFGLYEVWAGLISVQWTIFLLGLFWGMAAERAATDWDSVFALPPINSFDFWRWHALEKKRFLAVLIALLGGLLLAIGVGAL